MPRRKVIIMGAAGRDFHNFNVLYRGNDQFEVIAFTATQIPDIDGRVYPAALAGEGYPSGISIHHENDLMSLIGEHGVEDVVFSYSDVSYNYVMRKGSAVNAAGASFVLLNARQTMLKSTKPVVAICAVRTGCGKSQTTRKVSRILKEMGKKLVVVRHPMPYGNLVAQRCQRFATYEDLRKHDCTIEEREEYEPHLELGSIVYAGVDYREILDQAQAEADVVLWDGGNNDTPFFQPDVHIVVVDPLRPGHEVSYYPGEVNLRMADVVVINKETSATLDDIETVRSNIMEVNPDAVVIDAASPIFVDDPAVIKGKRVLAVEDGPTLTHGGMKLGAGIVAAQRFGASEIVDPRPYLKGSLQETFRTYPEIGALLPAMGYGEQQVKDLEATINSTDCDAVIIGTPIDLRKLVNINKPATRVTYELEEIGKPDLRDVLAKLA
ncbi:MAG: cyclic 2,3-diphosphoglycerate synthase [Calditrichaeota bacterium]|nr:cyclic 2,3-diphosphoglycerate synthase [Calditrichota bacterium]